MRYTTIAGIDRPVSRIALGSMVFSPPTQDLTCELLDAFLAHGGNLVDTAPVYRGGGSERAIGEWLRRRGHRADLLLLTKGAHYTLDNEHRVVSRVTPTEIAFDLGQSLERLGTSYVDLYLLHRDDPAVPVGPVVETLNAHAAKGRLRALGGSNWTHRRLQAANAYAAAHDLRPFTASSPHLSLAVPQVPMYTGAVSVAGDGDAVAWYRQHRMPLIAWSSQAGGFFTGRCSPEHTDDPSMVRVYYSDANWERLRRAQLLAAEFGCTAVQIALAWVLNQPDLLTVAVIGPRTLEELDSSLQATELILTPAQVAWLNLEVVTWQ